MEVEPERGDGRRFSGSSRRRGSFFCFVFFFFLVVAAARRGPPGRRREGHPDVEPGLMRWREALGEGRRRWRSSSGSSSIAAAVAEEVAGVGGEEPRERRRRRGRRRRLVFFFSFSSFHRDAKRREHVDGPVPFLDRLPEQRLDLAEGGGRLAGGGGGSVFVVFAGTVIAVGSSSKSSSSDSSGRSLGVSVSVIFATAAAAHQPKRALRRPNRCLDKVGERHRRLRRREGRRGFLVAATVAYLFLFLFPALGAHPVDFLERE